MPVWILLSYLWKVVTKQDILICTGALRLRTVCLILISRWLYSVCVCRELWEPNKTNFFHDKYYQLRFKSFLFERMWKTRVWILLLVVISSGVHLKVAPISLKGTISWEKPHWLTGLIQRNKQKKGWPVGIWLRRIGNLWDNICCWLGILNKQTNMLTVSFDYKCDSEDSLFIS